MRTSYPDRIKTLQQISGLIVTHHKEKGQSIFEFSLHSGFVVKTCFTYKKAKLFAEGVQFGMEKERIMRKPQP